MRPSCASLHNYPPAPWPIFCRCVISRLSSWRWRLAGLASRPMFSMGCSMRSSSGRMAPPTVNHEPAVCVGERLGGPFPLEDKRRGGPGPLRRDSLGDDCSVQSDVAYGRLLEEPTAAAARDAASKGDGDPPVWGPDVEGCGFTASSVPPRILST